jgi:hypothetical protein
LSKVRATFPDRRAALAISLTLVTSALPAMLVTACAPAAPGRGSAQGSSPARPAEAVAVVVAADNFVDTDGNRFRDTTRVNIYLFAHDQAVPTTADGSFAFQLETLTGEPLVEWRFDRQQTAAALRQLAPGPAYIFELSLFDATTPDGQRASDRLNVNEADLLVTFIPATPQGQQPRLLRGRPGAPLQVGGGTRGRQPVPPTSPP